MRVGGPDGTGPVERVMGSEGVELVAERFDVVFEAEPVGDVVAVEPFVFQGLEPAFDDAVGAGRAVPGSTCTKWGRCANHRHRRGLHGRAVVGDDHDRPERHGNVVTSGRAEEPAVRGVVLHECGALRDAGLSQRLHPCGFELVPMGRAPGGQAGRAESWRNSAK